MMKRAAKCVPLIKSTPLFVVDAQGAKRPVTDDELRAMNIEVQRVPNLYKHNAGAAAGPSVAPSPDMAPMMARQRELEDRVSAMQSLLEKIAASAVPTPASSKNVAARRHARASSGCVCVSALSVATVITHALQA